MLYHKQANLHDPDNGLYGDCYRTVLACLLDLPRDDVPHYVTSMDNTEWLEDIQPKYDRWLADRGLQEFSLAADGDWSLDFVLQWQRFRAKVPMRSMLIGSSRSECNHVVVVYNGEIEHDPAQNNSGITGPADDGYWHLTWLVPIPA